MKQRQAATPDPIESLRPLLVNNLRDFESWVLLRTLFDQQFFLQVDPVINRSSSGMPVNDFSDPIFGALYEGAKLYHRLTDLAFTGINWFMMSNCLMHFANEGKLIGIDEINPALHDLNARIQSANMEAIKFYTGHLIMEWLNNKRTEYLGTRRTMENWSVDRYATELQNEMKQVGLLGKAQQKRMFAFGEGLNYIEDLTGRFSTGLTGLDRAMGGAKKKETTLVIAGTGSGKTVKACLTASHAALEKRKTLLISTESTQGHVEMERRIVSARCNVPFTLVKDGINPRLFNPHQLKSYEYVQAILKDHLRIYEWPKGSMNVQNDLTTQIKMAQDEMGGLDVCELDWIGGALGAQVTDPAAVRLIYQNAADAFIELMSQHNLYGEYYAQAHIKEAMGKTWVDARHLAECKQLGRDATSINGISMIMEDQKDMIASGKPAFTRQQFFAVSKARKGEGQLVKVLRAFEYQRFEDPAYG